MIRGFIGGSSVGALPRGRLLIVAGLMSGTREIEGAVVNLAGSIGVLLSYAEARIDNRVCGD